MKKRLFKIEVFEGDSVDTFSFNIEIDNDANEVQLAVFCQVLYNRCLSFLKGQIDNLMTGL